MSTTARKKKEKIAQKTKYIFKITEMLHIKYTTFSLSVAQTLAMLGASAGNACCINCM